MLFDARPNTIHIFGLRIKQFLTASNIDFSFRFHLTLFLLFLKRIDF